MGALALATIVYGYLLCCFVDWAFTHPFNPADSGPRAFAAGFGWIPGLLFVVLPFYWLARGLRFTLKKSRRSHSALQNQDSKQTF